jgi:hypothetical protein
MRILRARRFYLVVWIAAMAGAIVFLLFILFTNRENKTIPIKSDFSIQLYDKQWETTITGQFTFKDIQTREQLPILILDLTVSNTTEQEFLLNCNLVRSNDKLQSIQDIYFPFWALNIKREDDLRFAKIPPKASQTGKLAFQLERTDESLWLDCGSDVKVRVQ